LRNDTGKGWLEVAWAIGTDRVFRNVGI